MLHMHVCKQGLCAHTFLHNIKSNKHSYTNYPCVHSNCDKKKNILQLLTDFLVEIPKAKFPRSLEKISSRWRRKRIYAQMVCLLYAGQKPSCPLLHVPSLWCETHGDCRVSQMCSWNIYTIYTRHKAVFGKPKGVFSFFLQGQQNNRHLMNISASDLRGRRWTVQLRASFFPVLFFLSEKHEQVLLNSLQWAKTNQNKKGSPTCTKVKPPPPHTSTSPWVLVKHGKPHECCMAIFAMFTLTWILCFCWRWQGKRAYTFLGQFSSITLLRLLFKSLSCVWDVIGPQWTTPPWILKENVAKQEEVSFGARE